MLRAAVSVAGILALAGCAELPREAGRPCPPCAACPACPAPARAEPARYSPAPFAAIPGWPGAPLLPGLRAFIAGCGAIGEASPLRAACDAALAAEPATEPAARRFLEAAFEAWSVSGADGNAEGLVTGYYEPVLAGSRERSARFRYPVYGVPPDLIVVDLERVNPDLRGMRLRGRLEGRRLVPYRSRAEIEDGAFAAPVLAWVEDPVELFFLQIQGSGRIALDSGGELRLGYADQNGHPYRSLGRYLVERGEMALDQASMQGIKAWAAANPAKLRAALDSNPSYVFFRELPAAPGVGPIGTLGVPLTAGYSAAVDPRAVPLGAPVFLATTWPLETRPLERRMAAQDTGGALRGAARVDFYWGSGPEAGALAGRTRQRGRLWVLWPKGKGPPAP